MVRKKYSRRLYFFQPALRGQGCEWGSWTCSYAAKNGHLHVLKWARENDCEWDFQTCRYAAQNGHLDVLKWARKNGEEKFKIVSNLSPTGTRL